MTKYLKSQPPPDPLEFVPKGWLTPFEAFNLVGRDRFPDEWMDGKELAAPSDKEIAANKERAAEREFSDSERKRRVEKAKRASVGVRAGKPAPRVRTPRPRPPTAGYQGPPYPLEIIADDEKRRVARDRGDRAWNQLQQWLYAGTVRAICLDDQGDRYEITENDWGRWNTKSMLFTGRATMNGRSSDVLISQADLEAAIRGEGEPEQAPNSEQSEQASSDHEPHAEKSAPLNAPLDEAKRPKPGFKDTRSKNLKPETEEKYQHWYNLAQEIKKEGQWTRPTEIAKAIAKREIKRLKGKGVSLRGINANNIRRRLDENFRGWSE